MNFLYRPAVKLDLTKMHAMPPRAVIEAVPKSEQTNPQYAWRGASLGALALNLMRGNRVLNAGLKDDQIHAVSRYATAQVYAATRAQIPTHLSNIQFTRQHAVKYERYARTLPAYLPAIVFGIDVAALRQADTQPIWAPEGEDAMEYIMSRPVSIDHIDPHSLAALQELWAVSLR